MLRLVGRLGVLVLALATLVLGAAPPSTASDPSTGVWIYLRGGEPPAVEQRLVEVLVVGDVMTGRGLADVPDLFGQVADVLRSADLAIGNLEGAIATVPAATGPAGFAVDMPQAGWMGKSGGRYEPVWPGRPPTPPSSEPTAVEPIRLLLPLDTPTTLADAGFDLLGLANNHALDAGLVGLAETRLRLQAAGLEPVETGRSAIRTIDGLRLAVLAWNDLGAPDHEPLLAAVREAQATADVVLVLVHWGQEYTRHPLLPQRELADELLQAGADAVLGSHPHVVQDLQLVEPAQAGDRPRLIAYSLGNFAFDQGWGDTAQGLALRLFFDARGLRAAQALPLWTTPRPRWMDPDSAAPLLSRVLPQKRQGVACSADTCEPAEVPDEARSGIFTSGAIDLTGDGVPEIVQRRGGTVEILQGGQLAWRSPPEWIVRDLALGDPNLDGRYEALLAVDRADGSSQPFVIGYRGGGYRDLWGGSPVEAPILEVELGDLDGDGLDELAVIEAGPDGSARYLTVWRWHGWGFSLVWRSPPGEYRDLIVLPREDDLPARLSVAAR